LYRKAAGADVPRLHDRHDRRDRERLVLVLVERTERRRRDHGDRDEPGHARHVGVSRPARPSPTRPSWSRLPTTTTDGICDSDCTLREALNVSNISEGRINISFAIDASGTQTITLVSGLPNITNPVVLDGTTEIDHQLSNGFAPPAAGEPAIEITGINEVAATASSSLRDRAARRFAASASKTSRSGTFEGFGASGVRVSSSGNTLEGLYVGTSSTGLLARPNDNGIVVTGDGNTIGPGNLVSGNSSYGIFVDGTVTGAADNVVTGNLVGTDRTGNAPLPGQHRDRGLRRAEDDHRRADGHGRKTLR
jgi:hypothetical protein